MAFSASRLSHCRIAALLLLAQAHPWVAVEPSCLHCPCRMTRRQPRRCGRSGERSGALTLSEPDSECPAKWGSGAGGGGAGTMDSGESETEESVSAFVYSTLFLSTAHALHRAFGVFVWPQIFYCTLSMPLQACA